jgi:hypothetical protein
VAEKAFSSNFDAGLFTSTAAKRISRCGPSLGVRFGQCGGLISKGQSTGRLYLDKEAVYAVENLVNKHAVTERDITEERSTSQSPALRAELTHTVFLQGLQLHRHHQNSAMDPFPGRFNILSTYKPSLFNVHFNLIPPPQIKSACPTLPLPKILQ